MAGWACMGNLNAIIYQLEKEGGHPKSKRQMDEFNEMTEDIQMEDLGAKGARLLDETIERTRRGPLNV